MNRLELGIRPRSAEEIKRFSNDDMKYLYNLAKNMEFKDLEIDQFNQQWFTLYTNDESITNDIHKNIKCTITISDRNKSNNDILRDLIKNE